MKFRRWLITVLGGQAGDAPDQPTRDSDVIPVLHEAVDDPDDPLEAEAAGLDFKGAIEATSAGKFA